jgi:hypothetical protein
MQRRCQTRWLGLAVLFTVGLSGCQKAVPSAPAATQFKITATVQDLMVSEVDPAADALWESVATIVTPGKIEDRQPRSDQDWAQARRHAIILSEAGNLLSMPGRRIAAPGKKLEDEGVMGVLTAPEAQRIFDAKPAAFVQFARSLHDVGNEMLDAIDTKNPQGMIDAGEKLDGICEGCHMTFWYPNQVIPSFPDEATEN